METVKQLRTGQASVVTKRLKAFDDSDVQPLESSRLVAFQLAVVVDVLWVIAEQLERMNGRLPD